MSTVHDQDTSALKWRDRSPTKTDGFWVLAIGLVGMDRINPTYLFACEGKFGQVRKEFAIESNAEIDYEKAWDDMNVAWKLAVSEGEKPFVQDPPDAEDAVGAVK